MQGGLRPPAPPPLASYTSVSTFNSCSQIQASELKIFMQVPVVKEVGMQFVKVVGSSAQTKELRG